MTPTDMDRFIEFMAANPSPVDCVVGRFYKVPCISHSDLPRAHTEWKEWIPLIGPPHQDKEYIGFEPWHIHVDSRFLTLESIHAQIYALGHVVGLTPTFMSSYKEHEFRAIRETAKLEVRRMKCRRSESLEFPESAFTRPLETAYADCRVINGLCPHRGIAMACGHDMGGGVRQCPGHGLAWNADGSLAPRMAEVLR